MQSRLRDGITHPKNQTDDTIHYPISHALLNVLDNVEPTCFSQASKSPEWRAAMSTAINALLHNKICLSFLHLPHTLMSIANESSASSVNLMELLSVFHVKICRICLLKWVLDPLLRFPLQ